MFKKICFTAIFIIFTGIFALISSCTFATEETVAPGQETLNLIDNYQQKYFNIIKRNDVLLRMEDDDNLATDRKELDDLFAEVENQITNDCYLKKYKKIQKRYSECPGITTPEINKCAEKNYKAISTLLNNVYNKAEMKLKFTESKQLAHSEILWEKEVEAYKQIYDSMGFGTIGTSIYYGYETNMKEFRTLLLMLYL